MIRVPSQLPPVGEPIVRAVPGAPDSIAAPWAGAGARFYASGTAALAAAIAAARRLTHGRTRVVLPAYGCPALVAATLWAGGRPVLVDLEPDRPQLALEPLERALEQGDVAAVIAVNFLGLPERLQALAARCAAHATRLIHDSAQAVPLAPTPAVADVVVYSFGRGKPVGVTGGGVAVARDTEIARWLPGAGPGRGLRQADAWQRLRVTAHNLALRPSMFGLLSAVPVLHIGGTRYAPLAGLGPMAPALQALLPANLARYRRSAAAPQALIRDALTGSARLQAAIVDLPRRLDATGTDIRLLRYPVLLRDRTTRERALAALRRAGLGASALYGVSLPRVEGMVETVCAAGPFPAAERFAARLLTLPTHSGVGARQVNAMRRILEDVSQTDSASRTAVDSWPCANREAKT